MEQFKDLRETDWHFKNEKEASEYKEWRNSITDELLYSLRLLDSRAYVEWDEEHHGVYVVYREIQTSFLEEPFLEEWFDYEKDAPALLKDLLKELGRRVNENILQNLWDLKNKLVKEPSVSAETWESETSNSKNREVEIPKEEPIEVEINKEVPLMRVLLRRSNSNHILTYLNPEEKYEVGDFVYLGPFNSKWKDEPSFEAGLVIKTFRNDPNEFSFTLKEVLGRAQVGISKCTGEDNWETIIDETDKIPDEWLSSWKINTNGDLELKAKRSFWYWGGCFQKAKYLKYQQVFKNQLWYTYPQANWARSEIICRGGTTTTEFTEDVQYVLLSSNLNSKPNQRLIAKASLTGAVTVTSEEFNQKLVNSIYYTEDRD